MIKIRASFATIISYFFVCTFATLTAAKPTNLLDGVTKYQHGYLLKQQTYIVQLKDHPLASYDGSIKGLSPTSLQFNQKTSRTGHLKLNTNSQASTDYKKFLEQQQTDSLDLISNQLNREVTTKFKYKIALNGFAVKLTPQEASQIALLDRVKSIQRASLHKAHTDRGPLLIQAPLAWDGLATGVSAKGEGMVVGVIDTGIRSNHQSFAATSPGDGYVHTNPLGDGVFLGYCATNAGFCNNKLIGAYNFADGVTDPEDSAGHGSHVTSTAAGNTLVFDLGAGKGFQLTGVAPRANIITYRIASDDTATGGATLMAIDQAITDGVDVINYSFGGGAFDPWISSDNIAFRNARAAGIVVATSAGNDGPNPGTVGSPAIAPWITSVAASTHDRGAFPSKTLSNMSGGSSTPPSTISGRSLTGAITAAIVYAGNFNNGDTNPEQCLNPFPDGTFTGQIVVCDRGGIARVQKAKNVAAGGAAGYVLANVQGGSSFLADDIYVIPGIQIAASDGDNLKSWLANGSGHNGTVNGTSGAVGVNPQAADIVAGFSSRGANSIIPDVIKPSVSAPGVSILAAGIGEVDYAFLQGTSMASPHVAGAMALIKQLKLAWSAGQIHSALVSTAITNLRKEDGITPADAFDMGGGRIDISIALNAGLLVDESNANFIAADPSNGGSPKTLNLPSMADLSCSVSCSWNRTLVAAVSDSWTTSFVTDTGLNLSVSPSSFSLSAGQSQSITIAANISGQDGDRLFGRLILTPSNNNVSTSHFPVAIQVNNSSLPSSFTIATQRDAGQHRLSGITSIASATLGATAYIKPVSTIAKTISVDSDNSSAFDDLTDGVNIELISVSAGSQLVFASTENSSATDLDLFVGFDSNGDGQVQESELLASSTSPNADERVLITAPQAGTYWILVQNFSGSTSADDSYTSTAGFVGPAPSSDITVQLPNSSDGVSAFNIDINYDNISAAKYFGVLTLGNGGADSSLGATAFTVNRLANDVSVAAGVASIAANETNSFTITIQPSSPETRNYTTSLVLPAGVTVDSASLPAGVSLSNNIVSWNPTVSGATTQISFDVTADSSLANQTVNLSLSHNVDLPNAKAETANTSFSVTGATGGGAGGGGTGGGNNGGNNGASQSSGGGSIQWLLLGLLFLSIVRRHTHNQ